jgi:predicted metal-dependent phosphoesterase TrpH
MTPDFKCELHVHSTSSDGSASPEELLQHAAKIGLSVVAITDHDNARGARAALPLAQEMGIELIPAIEFTTRWDACTPPGELGDIDVLGYFIDLDHPQLQAAEEAALQDIHARIAACCQRLTEAGYPVTLEEAFTQNPRYAGARQVRQVLHQKGFADSYEATAALFTAQWRHVRRCNFTIDQQIATIHAAGGVAILAHPHDIVCGEEGLIGADRIKTLVEMGIDGLEVYYHTMNDEARQHFLALAKQFNLLVTGGSDEHGWSPELPLMGTQPVTQAMVEALRARHRERRPAPAPASGGQEQPAKTVVYHGPKSTIPKEAPPAPPTPTRWLVIQTTAVLDVVATDNYACYGRGGVPQYGVVSQPESDETPAPPSDRADDRCDLITGGARRRAAGRAAGTADDGDEKRGVQRAPNRLECLRCGAACAGAVGLGCVPHPESCRVTRGAAPKGCDTRSRLAGGHRRDLRHAARRPAHH